MPRRIERKLNRGTAWVGVVPRKELGGLAAARAARFTHLATAATAGTSAANLVGAARSTTRRPTSWVRPVPPCAPRRQADPSDHSRTESWCSGFHLRPVA